MTYSPGIGKNTKFYFQKEKIQLVLFWWCTWKAIFLWKYILLNLSLSKTDQQSLKNWNSLDILNLFKMHKNRILTFLTYTFFRFRNKPISPSYRLAGWVLFVYCKTYQLEYWSFFSVRPSEFAIHFWNVPGFQACFQLGEKNRVEVGGGGGGFK